jgi:hypothetical protein
VPPNAQRPTSAVVPFEQIASPGLGDQMSVTPATKRGWLLSFKIAVFDWVVEHTPPLRRLRDQRDEMAERLARTEEELREVYSERDTLLRGIALLFEESASRPPS